MKDISKLPELIDKYLNPITDQQLISECLKCLAPEQLISLSN